MSTPQVEDQGQISQKELEAGNVNYYVDNDRIVKKHFQVLVDHAGLLYEP